MHKKVLFLVGSAYQLLNAVILKMTVCAEDECDLILRAETVWDDGMLARLKEKRIFHQVFFYECTDKVRDFWYLSLEERLEMVRDPLVFFGKPPVEPVYDQLFAAVDHIYWKMIYRYEVLSGKKPEVFMFDEGIRAYTMNIPETDSIACLQKEYAETRFVDGIVAYYLHQPELYSVKDYKYDLRKIPGLTENPHVKDALIEIYGLDDVPSEPYIYLEDYYFGDRHLTNDFELFEQVANAVGKENIIVKRHPRCVEDRFSPKGYKTVDKSLIPWEIQLMANDMHSKVLISVTSTAIFTPHMIFDTDMHVISLENLFSGQNSLRSDVGFTEFFRKLTKKINSGETFYHTPDSIEELREVLRYITITQ